MSREASGLKEDRKKVFNKALKMASGTMTSRTLGLLRDIAMAAFFERRITDAWAAAFRFPNLFRRLLGEGSLSVSFIPVFIEARSEDPSGVRARNLANGMYTLLLIAMGSLTFAGVLFTEDLFRLILSADYAQISEKWDLTVRLGRIMFSFVFFVSMYAYCSGVLNSLGSFGLPALAPALLNIAMLAFTFMPGEWFAHPGDGLAWGVLVGGLLQATLLWWALWARGYLPRWQGSLWSEDIRKVLGNMLPGLVGMGLLQFSTLVNLYYASFLPEGAISYIYWADRLLELPLSLISVSIGSVLLPTLSSLRSLSEREKFIETAQESFLLNLFLAWPAALGLFFLAQPIVEVLFLRGHFSASDALATATVLKVYAVSLVLHSCSRVLMPMYFALKNTTFPAYASLAALLLHISLAPSLMQSQGLVGLISAGVYAAALQVLLLWFGLYRRQVAFHGRELIKSCAKFMVSGLGLFVVVKIYEGLGLEKNQGPQVLALGGIIIVSMTVYFAIAALLRCEEFSKIRQSFRL